MRHCRYHFQRGAEFGLPCGKVADTSGFCSTHRKGRVEPERVEPERVEPERVEPERVESKEYVRPKLNPYLINEPFLLELEDGQFAATFGGLYAMQSEYFDALITSPMRGTHKLEDVHVEDFKELYELREYADAVTGYDPAWVEDWCNKLVLTDRFLMRKSFCLYARKLAPKKIVCDLPAPVVEILLTNDQRVELTNARWVELICEENLDLKLFTSRNQRGVPILGEAVRAHEKCTPYILSFFLESMLSLREIYVCVDRGLMSERAGLKWMVHSESRWEHSVLNASPDSKAPLEIDLLIPDSYWQFNNTTGAVEMSRQHGGFFGSKPKHFELREVGGNRIEICTEAELKTKVLKGWNVYAVI